MVAQGHARLIRNGEVVAEKKVDSLRRVKDEVKEVRAGTECGIHLENTNDYKEGDLIEIYEIHEIRAGIIGSRFGQREGFLTESSAEGLIGWRPQIAKR